MHRADDSEIMYIITNYKLIFLFFCLFEVSIAMLFEQKILYTLRI
jgi:hypothetical protein